MSTIYWTGGKQAKIKKIGDIYASWGQGPGCLPRMNLTNQAFEIWFNGRQAIRKTNSQKMRISMEKCGNAGWGVFGVHNLKGAFEHWDNNVGFWDDENTADFNQWGRHVPDCPEGIVNFFKEVKIVDEKIANAAKRCDQILNQRVYPKTMKREKVDADYYDIKQAISDIVTISEEIEGSMWRSKNLQVAPVTVKSGVRGIGNHGAIKLKTITKTLNFVSTVNDINDALEVYVKARNTFGSDGAGAAFAGITIALSYVPVLGSFYGEIVKNIPGLVEDFRRVFNNRVRTIDSAAKGRPQIRRIR